MTSSERRASPGGGFWLTVAALAFGGACTGEIDNIGDPSAGSLVVGDQDDSPSSSNGDIGSVAQAVTAGLPLCGSCSRNNHSQCGGPADLCLTNTATGDSFCGRDCRSAGCPSGYRCFTIGRYAQCAPPTGVCPDTAPAPAPAPAPTPAPAPPPSGSCGSSLERGVVDLANDARGSGLPELVCDTPLQRAARLHSEDMCRTRNLSHTGSDGSTVRQRILRAGGRGCAWGENLTMGTFTRADTPEKAHRAWMNSTGHRRNILNRTFQRIGVGHARCGNSDYWTQVFTDGGSCR